MTYEEYREHYSNRDHVMIRLTDSSPFFVDKIVVQDGIERVETNHHVCDGMYSTYINLEIPEDGLSMEISGTPQFEVSRSDSYPIFVTNVSDNSIHISERLEVGHGTLEPGEVLALWPPDLSEATREKFESEEHQWLSQDEILSLLSGKPIRNW